MVCLSVSLFKFLPFVFTLCWTLDWHEVGDFLDLTLPSCSWIFISVLNPGKKIILHYIKNENPPLSRFISVGGKLFSCNNKSTFMSGSDQRCFSQVSKLKKTKYLFAQQQVQPRVTKLAPPKLVAAHHSWFHNQSSTTSNRKDIVTLWNMFMGNNILSYAWRRDSQIKRLKKNRSTCTTLLFAVSTFCLCEQ